MSAAHGASAASVIKVAGMPLSEYEQRMLEQMERQLRSDDPKLADTLGSRGSRGSRVLLGVVVVVVGIGVLVGGAALQLPWLGVVGFLAMFGGVLLAVSTPRRQAGPTGVVGGQGPATRRRSRRSFMQRMEDRWDHRRDAR
jgi:hypothetical protein